VEHFALHELPRAAMREGGITQIAQMTDALREALHTSGTRLREAAIALPAGLVIRKLLMVPGGLSDEELELQVEEEAAQSLSFPLNELNLDFGVVGPSVSVPDSVDVILVATRKETIAERQELMESVGIKPVVVDIESQAMIAALLSQNALNDERSSLCARAILHIGRDSSYLCVEKKQILLFEHELNIGFHRLQKEVDRHPEQVVSATETFCSVACQEFKRALQIYATTSQHNLIDHYFLSGPEQSLSRLPFMLKDQLSIDAEFANPFRKMTFSVSIDKALLLQDASSWLVSCGLAMSNRVA
jgi:type IV pilus assembly protein PilM